MNTPSNAAGFDNKDIFKNLNLDEVSSVADLGATSPNLIADIFDRFGCEIFVISLNGKGEFDDKAARNVKPYVEALQARNIDMDKVTILDASSKVPNADVVVCVDGFGNGRNPAKALPWLKKLLGADSRAIMDIRKGSGAYGVLHPLGNVQTIDKKEIDGKIVARAILQVEPQEVQTSASKWRDAALPLIGDDGFYTEEGLHSFTFIKRSDVLVVTFDNLDIAMDKRSDRRPWGFSFIEKQGWSMLGVMATGWTWYRDPWVTAEFDRLRDEGFFDQFSKVLFYGASMGGYAALAFSPASPGAEVVAFCPQTILDKEMVPWETRYKVAWKRDFSDHYGDAAETVKSASNVYLFYDPYAPLDNAHAMRLQGDNVHHYRSPLMGHKVGTSFQMMGILKPIVEKAIDGSLTPEIFYHEFQSRKKLRRYLIALLNMAKDKNHPALALRVARYGQKQNPNDGLFKRAVEELS